MKALSFGLKVMAKFSFSKVGQTSRLKSQGQKLWYHVKVLSQAIHMCNMTALSLLV